MIDFRRTFSIATRMAPLIGTIWALGVGCAWGPHSSPDLETAPLLDGLGNHHYPISTGEPLAQRLFDQGLTLSYAFNHQEAARSFRHAARLDPDCAMAYWGLALVLGPNINAPMDPADAQEAFEAANRALSLVDRVSLVERSLIESLVHRYESPAPEDRSALDLAYAEAMRECVRQHPDDDEIATLAAESIMDLTPWDYWDENLQPHPATNEALGLLESVLSRSSTHPGANHLYIHAVEYGRPELGIGAAKRLETMLPGAGHMVHMPSHIYIRIGEYHEGTLANERAVLSDDAYVTQCRQQGIYPLAYVPHNHHFLWACATLEGRREHSMKAARELASRVDPAMMRSPGLETLQHYWVTPWYARVRFGLWNEILETSDPPSDLEYPNGVWHYARGMAFVRMERFGEAEVELEALGEIAERPLMSRLKIWDINTFASVLRICVDALAGELALARGEHTEAIARLESAVARQDSLRYNEPPDFHYPVRQSLGIAYLAAGRPVEAEAVYRRDLEEFPENGWSLFGLEQSLRANGRDEEAEAVRVRFDRAWRWADVTLESSRF